MRSAITCAAVLVCMSTGAIADECWDLAGCYTESATISELDALRADFAARQRAMEARQRASDERIADLERALATGGGGGDPCCRGEGWFGSAQAVWLKPFHGAGTGILFFGAGGGSTIGGQLPIGTDYRVSPRLELGYARCDGLGFRIRYWEYDHAFSESIPSQRWDNWVGDIEITDSTRLGCNWDATFAVGFRHVEYAESLNLFALLTRNFEGNGLTVAAEVRRPVSCNWGLFAGARGSAVYGDEHTRPFSLIIPDLESKNTVKYIWEAQAGVEWKRCLPSGGYLYARGFGEVQYWEAFAQRHAAFLLPAGAFGSVFDPIVDEPFGLAGFGVALGVVR